MYLPYQSFKKVIEALHNKTNIIPKRLLFLSQLIGWCTCFVVLKKLVKLLAFFTVFIIFTALLKYYQKLAGYA